jgi:hypothetical protein
MLLWVIIRVVPERDASGLKTFSWFHEYVNIEWEFQPEYRSSRIRNCESILKTCLPVITSPMAIDPQWSPKLQKNSINQPSIDISDHRFSLKSDRHAKQDMWDIRQTDHLGVTCWKKVASILWWLREWCRGFLEPESLFYDLSHIAYSWSFWRFSRHQLALHFSSLAGHQFFESSRLLHRLTRPSSCRVGNSRMHVFGIVTNLSEWTSLGNAGGYPKVFLSAWSQLR